MGNEEGNWQIQRPYRQDSESFRTKKESASDDAATSADGQRRAIKKAIQGNVLVPSDCRGGGGLLHILCHPKPRPIHDSCGRQGTCSDLDEGS